MTDSPEQKPQRRDTIDLREYGGRTCFEAFKKATNVIDLSWVGLDILDVDRREAWRRVFDAACAVMKEFGE